VRKEPFTVYVVDDDHSVRKALKRLLGSVGYHAITFASAEALLDFPWSRVKDVLSWIFVFRE
jgi:FixJ family two-component response regulator